MTRARSGAVVGVVEAGDIMIKHSDGSAISGIIRLGQFLGKGSSEYVHAGIASSHRTIIEMDGAGLQEHDLLNDNANYKYDVFRCNYGGVAAGACETAKMMLEGFKAFKSEGVGTKISYTLLGAARSIFKRDAWDGKDVININLDKLLKEGGTAFFCSGHVVLCYQSSLGQHQIQNTLPVQHAGQLFSLTDTCYQPAYLHKVLGESLHFTKIGTVKGAQLVY